MKRLLIAGFLCAGQMASAESIAGQWLCIDYNILGGQRSNVTFTDGGMVSSTMAGQLTLPDTPLLEFRGRFAGSHALQGSLLTVTPSQVSISEVRVNGARVDGGMAEEVRSSMAPGFTYNVRRQGRNLLTLSSRDLGTHMSCDRVG